MLKRNNRKGFTLAELLIVVAIIAVLIAIAVPIFVGALERAEKATIEANERTMKGLVVAEILDDDSLLFYTDSTTKEQKPVQIWYATGEYNATKDTWDIKKSGITAGTSATGTTVANPNAGKTSEKSKNESGDTIYTLYITINYVDVA